MSKSSFARQCFCILRECNVKTKQYSRNAICITKKEEEAEKTVKKKEEEEGRRRRRRRRRRKRKHIHQKLQLLMACSKFYFNLICCLAHCLIHYKCSIVFATLCQTLGLKQRRDAPILAQSVKPWPVRFSHTSCQDYAKYSECVVSPQQIKRL